MKLTRVKTYEFWRNLAVHFCICSIVGRWLEVPWCILCDRAFGIYDPESLVWLSSPLYPFCVYGVAAVVCGLLLYPLYMYLKQHTKHPLLIFFFICFFVCMAMELGMGWLMNQPDEFGVYPLWNNAILPFNVLNQAWLPNDLALGICALVYTCFIYPAVERLMAKPAPRTMNIIAACIIVAFIVICIIEFS